MSVKLSTAKCNKMSFACKPNKLNHQTKRPLTVRKSEKRQIEAGIHNTSCVTVGSDRPYLSLSFPHLSNRINPHRVAVKNVCGVKPAKYLGQRLAPGR